MFLGVHRRTVQDCGGNVVITGIKLAVIIRISVQFTGATPDRLQNEMKHIKKNRKQTEFEQQQQYLASERIKTERGLIY